jgi:hypothetical protein
VSIGIADVFTSLGTTQFTLYDNLYVEEINLPSTDFCSSNPNSTLNEGLIIPNGSTAVADNEFELYAAIMPQNVMGYFIASQTQGFAANPGGSEGNLCLGGSIGRYVGPGQIQNSGSSGTIQLQVDLTQTPTPTGFVSIQAGESWNFQLWHRDAGATGPTSNFTDGLELTFI